jgi:hypothetical protein
MSTTDTQAMGLLIRMLPLMQREFSLRVDPVTFFGDSGYRDAILDSALNSAEPRLKSYAEQMRQRLGELGRGPPGALRSAPAQRDFERTVPGALPPPAAAAPPTARPPATTPNAGTPAPTPTPTTTPPPSDPARKYVGRLR